MRTKIKILFVGPRVNHQRTNIGGATRSFEDLISYFDSKLIELNIVNSQERILSVFLKIIKKITWSNVIFLNSSKNGIQLLAPPTYLLARLFRKRIVIRPFGDSLAQSMNRSRILNFILHRTVLKSDILYLQTLAQIGQLKDSAKCLRQLKTSRPAVMKSILNHPRVFAKKFVYIGHIKESKGIDQLLEVIETLDETYQVEIFGPILESKYQYLQEKKFYKGSLSCNDEVQTVLGRSDVLVMPTYYEGEGYPGVIVEAYANGIPVITTKWKSIPEIVKHGSTGLLINPRSSQELLAAIQTFNIHNYKNMSKQALILFEKSFQKELILDNVVKDLELLINS